MRLVESGKLHTANMISLRTKHDTQVARHKGNEQHLINPEDLRLDKTTVDGKMCPSECSKAISVYMKSLVTTPTGAARRHRWNIDVKINIGGLMTNTSHHQDVDLQQLFDGGSITVEDPIEPGKLLVAIKNHVRGLLSSNFFCSDGCPIPSYTDQVGLKKILLCRTLIVYEYVSKKHAFVTSAHSRKKLSHVGVQVLTYDPAWPVAMPTSHLYPHSWTFSLLDAVDIIYVFKPSNGSNFASVPGCEGTYSVPSVIRDMFLSIKMDQLIRRYEIERRRLLATKPDDQED